MYLCIWYHATLCVYSNRVNVYSSFLHSPIVNIHAIFLLRRVRTKEIFYENLFSCLNYSLKCLVTLEVLTINFLKEGK